MRMIHPLFEYQRVMCDSCDPWDDGVWWWCGGGRFGCHRSAHFNESRPSTNGCGDGDRGEAGPDSRLGRFSD
jgi:hypothetical protein